MSDKEIEEYERISSDYQEKIADRMSCEQWMEYNEILFSAHPFDEALLKTVNRLVTEHIISYRAPGALKNRHNSSSSGGIEYQNYCYT